MDDFKRSVGTIPFYGYEVGIYVVFGISSTIPLRIEVGIGVAEVLHLS
jgi:hypothetical protein